MKYPDLTLPGSLALHLHELGLGVRPWLLPRGTKRHHFIAQFILRRFVDPSDELGRIWQLDKETGDCRLVAVDKAASRPRLYDTINTHGERTDVIETLLAVVDDHASQSLARMRERPGSLEDGDRVNLSFLLALQDARTPAGQRRLAHQLATAARVAAGVRLEDRRGFVRWYKRRIDPTAKSSEIERTRRASLSDLRDGDLLIEAEKQHAIEAMLATWLELAGVIADLSWKMLVVRDDGAFVIGDRPFTLHDPTPRYPWSGNGLRSSPSAYGLMPFTPGLCLRVDQYGARDARVRAASSGSLVAKTNIASYGWAERHVFGNSRGTLLALRERALADPEHVPAPRPDPQVIVERADPTDPDIGREHPPGHPRGLWLQDDHGRPSLHSYTLVYTDDPRTPTVAPSALGD